MKKDEFIQRYGEEAWKVQLEKQKRSREKMGGYTKASGYVPRKMRNLTNDTSFKVYYEMRDEEDRFDKMDRLETAHRVIAQLQKKLRLWWKSKTDKDFILVVDLGSKVKDRWAVKVNLTQLNMDKNTVDAFTKGAKEIIKQTV